MRFLFKRIFFNFYFALQIFAVSMVLLCGSFSYAETDVLKDFKNYAKEDIPLKVEKVKNSVVQLYIKDEIGTGFILEDGILATNSHAVENILNKNNFFSKIDSDPLSEIEILQEDRLLDVQVTSIQALDPVHDLALLNIKGSEIPPAIKKPRRKVDLTKEKLFFVGYPNGKLKAMGQKGTIEIFESKNHAEIYMPVFTSDIGGASGSPVVNQKGELVGALHSASNIERKIIFSNSDSLFSLQNAEYGVQCSKNTSIKDCFQQAEDFHLKEAQKGDAFVQYKLSLYFRTFYKYIKHLKWLNKAAQQGFVLAQNELGHQFFVHKIYKKAAKWFELGSQKGHIVPTFLLALMYYQGDGVPQDSKKSFELFKLAAQKGHREAYYFLGLMYHQGDGVPQDTKKAFEYFEIAAKQGHREAYHSLDVTHRDGQRVYRNEKKYFEYFKLAVQEKDSTVQKYLKKLSKNKKCIEVFNKGDHS